jgi:hypothetical protein
MPDRRFGRLVQMSNTTMAYHKYMLGLKKRRRRQTTDDDDDDDADEDEMGRG